MFNPCALSIFKTYSDCALPNGNDGSDVIGD